MLFGNYFSEQFEREIFSAARTQAEKIRLGNLRAYPPTSSDCIKYRGVLNRVQHAAMDPVYIETPRLLAAVELAFSFGQASIKVQPTASKNHPTRLGQTLDSLNVPRRLDWKRWAGVMDNHVLPETRRSYQAYLHVPEWFLSFLPKLLSQRKNIETSDGGWRIACTEFCIGLIAMGYDYDFITMQKSLRMREEESRKIQPGLSLWL